MTCVRVDVNYGGSSGYGKNYRYAQHNPFAKPNGHLETVFEETGV